MQRYQKLPLVTTDSENVTNIRDQLSVTCVIVLLYREYLGTQSTDRIPDSI